MPELLAQLRIARSSYFYRRARMCLADKYAAVRHSLAEIFEANRRCTVIDGCRRRWPGKA